MSNVLEEVLRCNFVTESECSNQTFQKRSSEEADAMPETVKCTEEVLSTMMVRRKARSNVIGSGSDWRIDRWCGSNRCGVGMMKSRGVSNSDEVWAFFVGLRCKPAVTTHRPLFESKREGKRREEEGEWARERSVRPGVWKIDKRREQTMPARSRG